ncbi:MAG: ABC transporter substrate-binding protein [Deltaproteobacteria bacterium]|nr:ABC transporter substrate-binding protein [Deltaproteobacteria bacterium]
MQYSRLTLAKSLMAPLCYACISSSGASALQNTPRPAVTVVVLNRLASIGGDMKITKLRAVPYHKLKTTLPGWKILLGLIVLALLLHPSEAWVQSRKAASVAELATYSGADREQVLYAGAKAEGKVVWYTSLAGGSYKEMVRAFEAKYPGVRVEAYRAGGSDLTVRMLEETKARRRTFDALETTHDSLMVSRANSLLRPYYSPHLVKYSEEAKEKGNEGLVFWTLDRESYIGFGYNKTQISPGGVPKGFEGLLNPELKGKLGIAFGETAAKVIGAMLRLKGEQFVKRLKAQEIKLYTVSSAALVDLIASGEIGASPHIFRNHALVSIERGSSVSWVPMEIVPTNAGGVALAAQPPRPHAGLLLVDFLLSDGQKVLEKFKYGHPSSNYGFKRWYPEASMSMEQYEKETTKWEKLVKEISQK